jgi:hypothetical protein
MITGEEIERVVDYKVKNSTISQAQADRDTQAGLYLAGRWLQGHPAAEFWFSQVAKPGPRRKQMSTAVITTTRTLGQMRATLTRIALAASEIAATYECMGPDRPWGSRTPELEVLGSILRGVGNVPRRHRAVAACCRSGQFPK